MRRLATPWRLASAIISATRSYRAVASARNSSTNGYIFRTVRVTLNNIPPTATPAPPTATLPAPVAPIGFTPLPFEQQSVPLGPATPTATLGGI